MKINRIEKIDILNDRKYKFISTKSIATLKLINALTCGNKIAVNPITLIEEEFLINYNNQYLYQSKVMTDICRHCLTEACNFINYHLLNKEMNLYLEFKEVVGNE